VPVARPVVEVRSPETREKKPVVFRADREARTQLRRAARERRRYERGEVRRFTRRARNRRIGWLITGGAFVLLGGMLAIAVYSPLLSLQTITVEGTERLDPATVQDAVADQVGKPLALVDFDEITRALGEFSLIRSYVTETIPPDTLVIHVTEREPVAVRENGKKWDLVDPAGIVVDSTDDRPEGVPILKVNAATDSPAFTSAVDVLLALPDDLLAQVHAVSATTADDVTLTLTGDGQKVLWGNADRSELKATALSAIMAKQKEIKETDVDYNLSSPTTPLVIKSTTSDTADDLTDDTATG
jgi:cell division protein FtsQ